MKYHLPSCPEKSELYTKAQARGHAKPTARRKQAEAKKLTPPKADKKLNAAILEMNRGKSLTAAARSAHVSAERLRTFLQAKLKEASVSRIHIERPAKKANITIHTARPGIVIGKKGEDIEKLRGEVAALLRMPLHDVRINIAEIRKPELDAQLVAEGIAQQLERRVQFRRAMRRAVTNTMRIGADGIKVRVSGRLNGAEIARSEWYREGRVPLHTLRADIDYGLAEAKTTYGVIGVKVWICRGEVFDSAEAEAADLMIRKACALFDAGQPCGAEANTAKMLASEASWNAAETCFQTFGGFAFAREYDVERKWRETRLIRTAPISTNLILAYIGQHVLGLPRSY